MLFKKILLSIINMEFTTNDYYLENIDWISVIKTAVNGGILNYFYYNFSHLGCDKLLDLKSRLLLSDSKYKIDYIKNNIQNELKLLDCAFKDKNIKVVLMKGESLNENVYNGIRDYSDIDLLISPDDFDA